ncbi:FHA domain protein [Arboricoccus pini]|uniref:FHA domain protein n=1 Tax=Arboricoccus pini TaxID=1963835 RepID=A0A212RQB9_9PROT|nr:type VI secretion system-associated FHA domain protein TagH [Arboricoccus pini]SNB74747.1 FHA domain protein [Arboricoccus pini]
MTLILRYEGAEADRPSGVDEEGRITIEERLAIGRAPDNGLVLLDTKRNISKHHCTIERGERGYTLVDHSRNGTYLNGRMIALAEDHSVVLRVDDRLQLSSFTLTVLSLDAPSHFGNDQDRVADVRPGLPAEESFLGAIDGRSGDPSRWAASPSRQGERGMASFLDRGEDAGDEPFGAYGARPSFADHVEVRHAAFVRPGVRPESIPDDWDLLAELGTPQSEPEAPAEEDDLSEPDARQPLQGPEGEGPASASLAAGGRTPEQAAIAAFLEGVGLVSEDLAAGDLTLMMGRAGRALRFSIANLHALLNVRDLTKDGFGVDRTMLGQSNNNPLKFVMDPQDALRVLLVRSLPGFLAADEAVEFAFKDIEAHQLALVAALRAALETVCHRLSPALIEASLTGRSPLSRLRPGARDAQRWAAYRAAFTDVTAGLDNDSARIFGREIAQSYRDGGGEGQDHAGPAGMRLSRQVRQGGIGDVG